MAVQSYGWYQGKYSEPISIFQYKWVVKPCPNCGTKIEVEYPVGLWFEKFEECWKCNNYYKIYRNDNKGKIKIKETKEIINGVIK